MNSSIKSKHNPKVLDLLRPWLNLSNLCGVLPFTVSNGEVKISNFINIYYVFSTYFYALSSCFMLYDMNAVGVETGGHMWIIEAVAFYVLSYFVAITNYVFRWSKIKMLNDLVHVTDKLTPRHHRKLAIWIYSFNVTLFIVVTMVQTWSVLPEFLANVPLVRIFQFNQMYSRLVVLLTELQYVNTVIILKSCFVQINYELEALKSRIPDAHYVTLKLEELRQWHRILNTYCRKLNSTFNLQIVASIIITFTQLTFRMYYLIFNRISADGDEGDGMLFSTKIEIVYCLGKFVSLCDICQRAKEENERIKLQLNKICILTDNHILREEVFEKKFI